MIKLSAGRVKDGGIVIRFETGDGDTVVTEVVEMTDEAARWLVDLLQRLIQPAAEQPSEGKDDA